MTYHSISICTECFKADLRYHLHPAYPCPSCGGQVLDCFSAQVTPVRGFLGFKTGRYRINLNSLRIRLGFMQSSATANYALEGAKSTPYPFTATQQEGTDKWTVRGPGYEHTNLTRISADALAKQMNFAYRRGFEDGLGKHTAERQN